MNAQTARNAVTLDGVSKSFGAVRALDGASLAVTAGELVCLLGPSGCGKTTLLRTVAGLERPDTGRVFIGERDVTDTPTRQRPIGMVFQSYALFPNLTVRQNIAFPLEVRHQPAAQTRQRVDELLSLTRLVGEADRYPSQISGGQAQRCALARALAPSPAVLLLDEPLSALDALVRTRLRDEIRRIQRAVGTTTIYVTHDQSEALAIADRVALMNHGRIEQVATPVEIYSSPATRFSADFVGGRNAVEAPVVAGRVELGRVFSVAAPAGSNGHAICFFGPEDVEIRAAADFASDGSPATGGQPARVELRTFQGPVTRLHLALDVDGRPVRIHGDVPTRDADAFVEGTQVAVWVDPARVRAFPAEA